MSPTRAELVKRIAAIPGAKIIELDASPNRIETKFKADPAFPEVLNHFADLPDLQLSRRAKSQTYTLIYHPHATRRIALRIPDTLAQKLRTHLTQTGTPHTDFFIEALQEHLPAVEQDIHHRTNTLKYPLAQRRTNIGPTKQFWVALNQHQKQQLDTAAQTLTRGNRSHLATLLTQKALQLNETQKTH